MGSRGLLGVLGVLGAAGITAALVWGGLREPRRALAVARHRSVTSSARRPLERLATDPSSWPSAEAPLAILEPDVAPGVPLLAASGRPLRVMLDPGHGARANSGNTSTFCVAEQDAMMEVAEGVADRLEASGRLEVRLAREPGSAVEYAARLADAASWSADAFVSLHSDVRGKTERWAPAPGLDCPIALDAPGFSVLYSDEGAPALASRRRSLGLAASRRMSEAGFLPYRGLAYVGLYAEDEDQPGLFVDRHAPDQRIFVLRRAAMPSILIETHNALDPREAMRWADPETLDAFAAALLAALSDVFPSPDRRGGT